MPIKLKRADERKMTVCRGQQKKREPKRAPVLILREKSHPARTARNNNLTCVAEATLPLV
jgi:hypothetical protein